MIPRIALTLAMQLAATAAFAEAVVSWKPIQPGVELATIPPGPLYVVRIDPRPCHPSASSRLFQ